VYRVRNVAAASADGELLAFVDADHEISDTWVAAAADALSDVSVGGAGALCLPPPDGTAVQKMYGVLRGRTRGASEVTWLGSGNLLIRKDIFVSLGGFDENLETCEDVDLCQRLREGGWKLVGDERLVNIHLGDPATLKAVFTSERWRGRDNLRVSLRRVPALRDWPSILFPIAGAAGLVTLVLALVAWPFVGNIAGVAAALGLSAVVGPSVLRTLRMLTGDPKPDSAGLAFMVAMAYDLGRACSLLMPAGHRQRQRTERPVSGADA